MVWCYNETYTDASGNPLPATKTMYAYTLQWTEPSPGSGIIKSYDIRFQPQRKGWEPFITVKPSPQLYYFKSSTVYSLAQIRATNSFGVTGDWTNSFAVHYEL